MTSNDIKKYIQLMEAVSEPNNVFDPTGDFVRFKQGYIFVGSDSEKPTKVYFDLNRALNNNDPDVSYLAAFDQSGNLLSELADVNDLQEDRINMLRDRGLTEERWTTYF